MASRQEIILRALNLSGLGLEIGPSHNPIAPKKAGHAVKVMDHLSQAELVAKYKDHNVALSNIEEVDYIWHGQKYRDLVGDDRFDWIIGSHMIEHTPDLIGFLRECESILKPNGMIALAVPDKRFCFDFFRPITGLARIIDAHLNANTIHSAGSVAEYFLNVVSKDGSIAWGDRKPGQFKDIHGANDALSGMQAVKEQQAYLDVHAWCFTPSSFRLMMHDLNTLGLIQCVEIDHDTSIDHEFFVTLQKSESRSALDRKALASQAILELSQQAQQIAPPPATPAASPRPAPPTANFAARWPGSSWNPQR